MKKIAIICCYNNREILDSMLIKGLDIQQDVEIEKIFYYNTFPSAAAAYNAAITESDSEYFVFVHQDIRFDDNKFLYKLIEDIDNNRSAIFGLCGTKIENNRYNTYSNVYHGLQNCNIGKNIDKVLQVEGLDEIFVAFHRNILKIIKFDENTFDGWHVFVEDLCIQVKLNSIKVYIVPYKSQHKNCIEMPKYMMIYNLFPNDYYKYIIRLRNKYKNEIKQIVCPCIVIETDFFKFWIKIIYKKKKNQFYRWLRRVTMK